MAEFTSATGKILSLALCFYGLLLLTACDQSASPSKQYRQANMGLYSAAFDNNGQFNFVGSLQHGGSLWRSRDQERLFDWNHKAGERSIIVAAAFSPEGDFVATTDRSSIVLWRTDDGKAQSFSTPPGKIQAIALGPDGDYALLGLDNNTAVIFDIKRGGVRHTFAHKDLVRSVALSNDGKIAVTASDDFSIAVWDLSNGQNLRTWPQPNRPRFIAMADNGRYVFSASLDGLLQIWDINKDQAIRQLSNKRLQYQAARFSKDGTKLLTGTFHGRVQLWDLRTGNLSKVWAIPKKQRWKPQSASVLAVAFAKQGYLATASSGFSFQLN